MEDVGSNLRLVYFSPLGFYKRGFCRHPFERHFASLEPSAQKHEFDQGDTSCPCLWVLLKVNFDGCFLGNLEQLGIGRLLRSNFGMVQRTFLNNVEAKIRTLLRGLLQVKTLSFFSLLVGDIAIII